MPQITSTILMVRPAKFGYNPETAVTNAFQQEVSANTSQEEIAAKAQSEFDNMVAMLQAKHINIIVVEDTAPPVKPDAVFPNNWVSFHEDGSVVTYPMCTPNRRIERREDIIKQLSSEYRVATRLDLTHYEIENRFLEGTGSMVLDRNNKLAYACLGPRTDEGLLKEFCKAMNYTPVLFHATDAEGQDIYHTNVVMAVGTDFVVICKDAVQNMRERALLDDYFEETGKEVIAITLDQMNHFAGNMLQVKSITGSTYLVMSEQAMLSLTPEQKETIETFTNIIAPPLYTIEQYGGGSARCMMAEVFLPNK